MAKRKRQVSRKSEEKPAGAAAPPPPVEAPAPEMLPLPMTEEARSSSTTYEQGRHDRAEYEATEAAAVDVNSALPAPRSALAIGRAEGTPSEMHPPVVDVAPPTRCPKCGSTARGDYFARTEQRYAAVLPDGRHYRAIVRRRCRCLGCGQIRIDREYV